MTNFTSGFAVLGGLYVVMSKLFVLKLESSSVEITALLGTDNGYKVPLHSLNGEAFVGLESFEYT